MEKKKGYIPQHKRKKILLLADDLRFHSGIATMSREIVIGTAHRYNWYNLGAASKHPDQGKIFDISDSVNEEIGIDDANVKIQPNTGYGDSMMIRKLMEIEKPDAIFIFTDPRYWTWLFEIEREIRSKIPIFYLNIWDNYPAPMYNKSYYDSVDLLMAISKQTKNINEIVLGEKAKNKIIKYIPHGVNEKYFFPITTKEDKEKLEVFKTAILGEKEYDFIVFFNSRNIRRKSPGDVILSYKIFCDLIGEKKAQRCALIMHTQPIDENGTDLYAVKQTLCKEGVNNVFFSSKPLATTQLNLLYNLADTTMLISSNEGWGLSLTESMMAGTMIVANTTGGMQDQMRFEKNGKWVNFTPNFPSNHNGTIKECGEWAEPIIPANRSLIGSTPTPYIYDDRCEPEDVAKALQKVYKLGKKERTKRGLKGHEWVVSDESGMSARVMAENVIKACDEAFKKFTPRERFEVFNSNEYQPLKVTHKIYGY